MQQSAAYCSMWFKHSNMHQSASEAQEHDMTGTRRCPALLWDALCVRLARVCRASHRWLGKWSGSHSTDQKMLQNQILNYVTNMIFITLIITLIRRCCKVLSDFKSRDKYDIYYADHSDHKMLLNSAFSEVYCHLSGQAKIWLEWHSADQ